MSDKRERILDAAARVMAERGYERATVRQIAQSAGVSDGTIYNVFADKQALLDGLLDRLSAAEGARVELGAAPADFRRVLQAFASHRVDALWPRTDLLRALWPELLVQPELRERYRDRVLEPALRAGEALLAASHRRGDLQCSDPALMSRLVLGAILGLTLLRLLGDPVADAADEAIPEMLAACLVDGLGGRDPS